MSDHKHKGRLGKVELDYIKSNANTLSYLEIATQLNRDPESIKNALLKMGLKPDLSAKTYSVMMVAKVEDKAFWPHIQSQFTEEELEIFKFQWQQMFDQFKDDVLPTEELQIQDVITIGILAKRNLDEQHKSRQEIAEVEKAYQKMMAAPEDERDVMQINNLSAQLCALRSAQGSLTKEYKELIQQKNSMFEKLKATRADRKKYSESSRESFFAWLNEIINNPERRREVNMQMEKMRLAAINEQIRLAAYHKYEDGMVDQPLLTPETVKET